MRWNCFDGIMTLLQTKFGFVDTSIYVSISLKFCTVVCFSFMVTSSNVSII